MFRIYIFFLSSLQFRLKLRCVVLRYVACVYARINQFEKRKEQCVHGRKAELVEDFLEIERVH